MLFKYKAKNTEGKTKEGEMEAKDQLELARILRDDGFYILEAKAKSGSGGGFSFKNLATIDLNYFVDKIRGVPLEEKMMFSRNLSVMITSGIPLSRSLEVLEKQTQSPLFREIIQKMNQDIRRGKNFSDAVASQPKAFGKLYSSMVKAGEVAGNLDEALNILANQLEKQHTLRSRVRGAMMYPAVIITVMIAIGILMMIYVVPQLKAIFSDLGAELPATTRAIIAASDFLQVYWWMTPILFVAFIFGVKKSLDTQWGARAFAWLLLHMPIFKTLVRKINNANFSRTLSSLVSGGVPILEALRIVSDTLPNVYYKESLENAAEQVKKGKNLYEVLGQYDNLYTPLLLEMVQVGEEAGKLSDLLERVAGFYEEAVNETTENMSSIIEPILMVFIGGAVGFFAISIMQPIYGMLGQI
ncbi:MAG: type II secretion system F family protein [Candidatus Spechtbacterales bacterium]|nr:type II secretion system F family protein [Candidatus Spechtbacterales bacterium]